MLNYKAIHNYSLFLLLIILAYSPSLSYGNDNLKKGVEYLEHTVKRGENLHLLSTFYYENARKWEKIYNFNRDVIQDPNILEVGSILKIPLKDASKWKPKFTIENIKQQLNKN